MCRGSRTDLSRSTIPRSERQRGRVCRRCRSRTIRRRWRIRCPRAFARAVTSAKRPLPRLSEQVVDAYRGDVDVVFAVVVIVADGAAHAVRLDRQACLPGAVGEGSVSVVVVERGVVFRMSHDPASPSSLQTGCPGIRRCRNPTRRRRFPWSREDISCRRRRYGGERKCRRQLWRQRNEWDQRGVGLRRLLSGFPAEHKRRQRRTVLLGMRDQKTGTTGIHPHFEKHGRRSYQEEGIERGIDRLVQS